MTNILVVDDAVESAEILAALFEALGHKSHLAFDGQQAIEAAMQHAPHIIFLDLDMPILDGYQAAKAIRATPQAQDLFIVALTGQEGTDVASKVEAAGFDFYLRKPADTNALIALVEDLEKRRRGRSRA